ncbi:hypothetical protein RJ641_034914 [Dillenia turbinata]|uniref:Uncharacterized protein n=1 Tax=Dillenia turbinata TaxID=194707 RepID=A0AAN8VN25_9MAGN
MRNGIEVAKNGAKMQGLFCYLGVSNGNTQEGSLHCDVLLFDTLLVLLPRKGSLSLALRTKENKYNVNGHFEQTRQVALYNDALYNEGKTDEIVQETHLWEDNAQSWCYVRFGIGLKKEGKSHPSDKS